MITLSSNTLCKAAIQHNIYVRLLDEQGRAMGFFGVLGAQIPDIETQVVDVNCRTVEARPLTLAGQLFLSLLKEGA